MSEAKIYYQDDCNLAALDGKTIAVIGYGSQGRTCIERKGVRMPRNYWSL